MHHGMLVVAVTTVPIDIDRLVLLPEGGDDVGTAVTVHVGDACAHDAVPWVEHAVV